MKKKKTEMHIINHLDNCHC